MANRMTALEEQTQSMDAHDIVQRNQLDTLLQNIHVLACSRCGIQFQSPYTLRTHELYQHGEVTTYGYKLNIARDAHEGRPTCIHCGQSFVRWSNFAHHISSFSRPDFDPSKASCMDLAASRRRLLDIHDAGGLQLPEADRGLCTFLSHRCVLRGCWAARTQMGARMSRDHPEA